MSRESLAKQGYKIKERNRERKALPKRIIWWRKGYPGSYHYKCEGLSPNGDVYEGVGDTLDEALRDLQVWMTAGDNVNGIKEEDFLCKLTPNDRAAIKRIKKEQAECRKAYAALTPQERKTRIAKHARETIQLYSRSIAAYMKKGRRRK